MHLQKRTKWPLRKLQASHLHFGPWRNCGASRLGRHFWAHEEDDDDLEQSA